MIPICPRNRLRYNLTAMRVRINGKERELAEATTLLQLLQVQ
jgi:hypothetical protein